MGRLKIIGGGLAGSEAAWQAAALGMPVTLYEMRPAKQTGAHKTGSLAELVCSNSLRASALENAVGLLKEEMSRFGSLVVEAARASAVPAGGALAVDRDAFSAFVEARIAGQPLIDVRREEVIALDPDEVTLVACGPLASAALAESLAAVCGKEQLHYYDAASPIVAADSIDMTQVFEASRYDKGGGADYLNIPLDREQYTALVNDLTAAEKHEPHGFETDAASRKVPFFEACLPVEEMARRGEDTLRFGPLKPVGLVDPRTGRRPHAVVQLRRENAAGTAYNLVGFQTRLSWPAQKAAFGKLPGLANAEWLRLGVMHRNTFVDAPRVLAPDLSLRNAPNVFLAGQVSGCEGYVEAGATGIIAAVNAVRRLRGSAIAFGPPPQTAHGALLAYLSDDTSHDFQPQNVTFAYVAALDTPMRDKRARRRAMADRALAIIDAMAADLASERHPPVRGQASLAH
ncbi:MAG TPA: methylenetetrahydrofolate--tRNA-(uracil(54)-C(5))-methyltransferase (FADH(2)-oxidizing) TrmFO [Candidatus Eremiobacteraceae bacterium]|nr:methylenetetrahydrofolate--tRNA-(uracil(54)-C(5))-methyltransferase (FADH(2)-oxidizing) TrmFO [Candidatus Eremiobacteraceae bacterium]